MKLLGIDFGKAKVGLAISGGSIAAPLKVIHYESQRLLIVKLLEIIEQENITGIVVGISENLSETEAREFAELLAKHTKLKIDFEDETLSTQEANFFAMEAGIRQKKRREMEDAFAASIILQRYLDNL